MNKELILADKIMKLGNKITSSHYSISYWDECYTVTAAMFGSDGEIIESGFVIDGCTSHLSVTFQGEEFDPDRLANTLGEYEEIIDTWENDEVHGISCLLPMGWENNLEHYFYNVLPSMIAIMIQATV